MYVYRNIHIYTHICTAYPHSPLNQTPERVASQEEAPEEQSGMSARIASSRKLEQTKRRPRTADDRHFCSRSSKEQSPAALLKMAASTNDKALRTGMVFY